MFGLINRGDLPTAVEDEFESLTANLRGFLLVAHNPDGTIRTADPSLAFVPVGAMNMWPTATAPTGWLLCDGSQVSRVTYNELFNLVGTTYGVGDGSTTFNLPDLRQRFPLGKAASGTGASLGATGGTIDHTHASTTLSLSGSTGSASPGTSSNGAHTHTVSSHSHSISSSGSHQHGMSGVSTATSGLSTEVQSGTGTTVQAYPHAHGFSSQSTDSGGSHDHGGSTGSQNPGTDSQGAHTHTVDSHSHTAGTLGVSGNTGTNNPPFIALNFIIFAGV